MSTTPNQTRSFADPAGYGARLLGFDPFDPSLGSLNGISLGVAARITGTLAVESLEARAYAVTYEPSALVSVFAPGGGLLMQQAVDARQTVALAAFDGSADFAGQSGAVVAVSGTGGAWTDAGGTVDPTPSVGTFALPVGDYATSRITGPANMRVMADAAVGAEVTLAYDYTPAVVGGFYGVVTTSGNLNGSIYVYNLTSFTPSIPPVTVTTTAQVFRFDARTTGWHDAFAVARFDPALGTLSTVNLRVVGTLAASAAAENRGAAPATVRFTQDAATYVSFDNGMTLGTADPSVTRWLQVGASDGVDDFGGGGGAQDIARTATATLATTLGTQAQRDAFSGSGSLELSIHSLGQGIIEGPADFLAEMTAQAGAVVEVSYTYVVAASVAAALVADTTTGNASAVGAETYRGQISGLQHQYISTAADNLAVAPTTDKWFIHTGDGDDAIAVCGGVNVIDGGGGSNFLTGGFGADTFFVDTRGATEDTWSTIAQFRPGDAATLWGISAQDFALAWFDGEGAVAAEGLTLHATAAGRYGASITLQGYSTADLANGALSVSFGTSDGTEYLYIRAA